MTDEPRDTNEHPRGTLAVVAVFAAMFLVAYLLVFFLIYLPRGAVTR
ncbi:MAG TPA: cytochrome c oxidase subunit 2A [Gemmatimonadales bacterium]